MKDSTGRFLTKALFVEFSDGRFSPVFTLKDEDDPKTGCKSLRRLYMEHEDPTEARFAESVFGNRQHWKKLCTLRWFQPYLEAWREDLEERIAAKGFQLMISHAGKSPQAARWLADRGWKQRESKGRPTNQQIEQAAREKAEDADFYRTAAGRMFDDDED